METGNRKTRLQKLSGSDFEIVDDQPDIRGWDVKDDAGNELGEVEELIFDYETQKVRYLVIELKKNTFHENDREVLVPIGIAELHANSDEVILPGVTPEQLASLPEYDEDRFDTEHESNVRNVFGGLGATTENADSNFYNHAHFNEKNLYKNRSVQDLSDGEFTSTSGDTKNNVFLRSRNLETNRPVELDENYTVPYREDLHDDDLDPDTGKRREN